MRRLMGWRTYLGGEDMKRFWKILTTIFVLGLVLVGCGKSGSSSSSSQKQTTVKIGVVGADNRVLQAVAKKVKKEGITIKIVQFSDYNQPNTALRDHDIDLNLFQHQYFLNNWNKTHKADLVSIGQTIIAPLAIYSKKITKISQIKKGDTIALPNDPTNEGRALQLLETAGLIKLNKKVALPTTRDVTENKLDLQLKAVDAAQTASSLPDVALHTMPNWIPRRLFILKKSTSKANHGLTFSSQTRKIRIMLLTRRSSKHTEQKTSLT